jgi:hypothetical protein
VVQSATIKNITLCHRRWNAQTFFYSMHPKACQGSMLAPPQKCMRDDIPADSMIDINGKDANASSHSERPLTLVSLWFLAHTNGK